MNDLIFREIQDEDIPQIEIWLKKDYIKKWFEVSGLCSIDDWLSEIKKRNAEYKWITYFIALWEKQPIGFCLYYKCADSKENWYKNIALDGTYSIDYLIGEEKYLNRGIGKEIIHSLIERIFNINGAERIIVQPDKENKASCNTLLSCGFIFDEENLIFIYLRR